MDTTGFRLSGLVSLPDPNLVILNVDYDFFNDLPITSPFVTNDGGVQGIQWTSLNGADPQIGAIARINLAFAPVDDPCPGFVACFRDVPDTYWSASQIETIANLGITGGCDATHYCPGLLTTRAEMEVFLLRAKYGAAHVPPTPVGVFNDVAVSYWAARWIEQLAAEGITSGCGDGNYCPADPVNRDQMAVFLVNTFEL